MLLHDGERRCRHFIRRDRERRGEHNALHVLIEEVIVLRKGTTNDAVRHESDKFAVRIHDGDGTEPLVRHDKEGILCRRIVGDDRIFVARVHHVGDREQQLAAKRAARMEEGIVLLLEVACRHERHRDRIAHRECRGCGACRCKPQRTCLALDSNVDVEVCTAAELGFAPSAHGDDARADAVDDRENIHDLVRLAAV